jgi:hypothetical protein
MSIESRNTLKTGFVAGTAATQSKFADFIDSAYNRSDDSLVLGPTGINGTYGLLGPTGGTYGMFVYSGANWVKFVGTTA